MSDFHFQVLPGITDFPFKNANEIFPFLANSPASFPPNMTKSPLWYFLNRPNGSFRRSYREDKKIFGYLGFIFFSSSGIICPCMASAVRLNWVLLVYDAIALLYIISFFSNFRIFYSYEFLVSFTEHFFYFKPAFILYTRHPYFVYHPVY